MNAIVESRLKDFLRNDYKYGFVEAGSIVQHMTSLARMAGHDLDERFAQAGLNAGPEARVASGLVGLALGAGGAETSEYTIRQEIRDWLRKNPPRSALLW